MEVQFKVDGMSCAHCEKRVKNALLQLSGVNNVEVDLEDKIVHVNYNQSIIKVKEISREIEEQGYDVVD